MHLEPGAFLFFRPSSTVLKISPFAAACTSLSHVCFFYFTGSILGLVLLVIPHWYMEDWALIASDHSNLCRL